MENLPIELAYALDTFYFLMCTVLVMWMAAGFAMLESGLVRSKNTVEILNKNALLYGIACIVYLVVGYNVMYPADPVSAYIPGFDFMLGDDNSTESVVAGGDDAPYYSGMADFIFQAVFAAATMSIVSGAVAERMRLWPFLTFAVFMVAFIYPVEGYWKWGGGFLDGAGFLDFAGSTVVHSVGGWAALTGALILGPRIGKFKDGKVFPMPGSNLSLATLGTFILWIGWFGFNGGSQLAMGSVGDVADVSRIFANTNTAAAGGAIAALILTQVLYKKPDLTMVLNGALAGLVSITAEPLTPTLGMATIIGAIGGIIVVFTVPMLDKMKIDDVVGAIPVHLFCGIWGTIAVVLTNGDASLGAQLYGIIVIAIATVVMSAVVWFILKAVMGIRVSEEDEINGLDTAELGMEAYPEFGKS